MNSNGTFDRTMWSMISARTLVIGLSHSRPGALLDVRRRQIERLLEEAASVAIASLTFEQPRGLEVLARTRVEVDRLGDIAELLSQRRRLAMPPHDRGTIEAAGRGSGLTAGRLSGGRGGRYDRRLWQKRL